MRLLMMPALLLTMALLPSTGQARDEPDPQFTTDAEVEMERLRVLLDKMRADCPDSGVLPPHCTDAGHDPAPEGS